MDVPTLHRRDMTSRPHRNRQDSSCSLQEAVYLGFRASWRFPSPPRLQPLCSRASNKEELVAFVVTACVCAAAKHPTWSSLSAPPFSEARIPTICIELPAATALPYFVLCTLPSRRPGARPSYPRILCVERTVSHPLKLNSPSTATCLLPAPPPAPDTRCCRAHNGSGKLCANAHVRRGSSSPRHMRAACRSRVF